MEQPVAQQASRFSPKAQHRFSFGLWTVNNVGRDPFGDATRSAVDPVEILGHLSELGVYGVSLHDNDLVPFDADTHERDRIVRRFQGALDRHGLCVSMATTNLFTHPVFKDGAFTANEPEVRRFAIAKTMRSIDLAAELEAPVYVLWGGREGSDVSAAKPPREALARYKEALDFLCGYVSERGYELRFALEPKPNEPRSDLFLPTVGHALAFIETLDQPAMVGVNPEVAHETMAGLNVCHGVAQALNAAKLFHIDLNGQRIGRYDQDLRFGAADLKEAFYLVKLLEESGYDGPRHFDAHAQRTEGQDGVWDFARACMRTYLVLAERAKQFAEDDSIAEALAAAGVPLLSEPAVGPYSPEAAAQLLEEGHDLPALSSRECRQERLDQLVDDLLLGTLNR